MTSKSRVLVVTNFATHYRAPLFELMHERFNAEFIFFSRGGEEYWQPHLGVTAVGFPATTATTSHGFGKVRFNTALMRELEARQFDVVIKCMNGRVELPLTYLMARRKHAAFVLWTGMWMHPQTTFHRLSRPATRWVYRNADSIVTYGEHVRKFVISEGADPAGVFVAENATNNALYSRACSSDEVVALRARYHLQDRRVVLAVSRLVPAKGLEYLIDAIGLLEQPRPHLLVVGTGPDGNALLQRAKEHGVRLVLVGGVQPNEMAPFYALSDAYVMPSVATRSFKETWGLACNEAMCQGTPVIVTESVGAAAGGMVVDRATGLVVPERDSQTLATALTTVLGDATFARQIGERGRARVAQTGYEGMLHGFEQAIDHALSRRGANQ